LNLLVDLAALIEAMDQLVGQDPMEYGDTESIVALERQLSRFECFVTKSVVAFETAGAWALDGAKTPAAWLSTVGHLPKTEARRQLRRGRALTGLPICAEAWSNGDIGGAHLDLLDKARTDVTKEAMQRDEALLVEQAKGLKFEAFCGAVGYWAQLADPNGAEESEMERQARRDVFLTSSLDGMWFGQMTFDSISGTIVSEEHQRLERQLFEADWAKAAEELGRDPKIDELARTSAQRRADAMVEMAIRSKSAPADGRRPEPLFSVLVGYETMYGRISELANGHVVPPGALLPWIDGADFERIVFAPGKRVEVSETARFFTGATRRAIELRDRECTAECCDVRAERCQIDHIIPYGKGGLTNQENGRVLCGFHNRSRNQRPPPGD
jgi:hypothetical protein